VERQPQFSRLGNDPNLRLAVSGRRAMDRCDRELKRTPDCLWPQSTLSRLLGTLGALGELGSDSRRCFSVLRSGRRSLGTGRLDEIMRIPTPSAVPVPEHLASHD
jgi:hypothetical protein